MTTIQEQLISYLEDAHALEQHVEKALQSMISSAPNEPELQNPLRDHLQQTRGHIGLVEERLRAHGAAPSKVDLSFKQEGLEGAPPIPPPEKSTGATPPEGAPPSVPPEQHREPGATA
jgi:hypothetical protein